MGRLDDKVCLVTGGGSGIGKATAAAYSAEGAKVVVADIDLENGRETAEAIGRDGGTAVFIEVDVKDGASVRRLVEAAVSTFGRLDVAFNNAGIEGASAPTDQYTQEAWDQVIAINLTGVWLCCKYEIGQMLKQKHGVIVNMSSILGKVAFDSAPAYVAAKHGVIGVTQTAAIEYADKNIRVNAVCPGFVRTPMLERAGITTNEEVERQITILHPMRRLARPEEIATLVTWLSSDEASFVTGAAYDVDGGYLAR